MSVEAFVTPLAGLLFLPRLPPPKLDKESSSGPTSVDCGLLEACQIVDCNNQKRSLEPRSASTRNFETFTTKGAFHSKKKHEVQPDLREPEAAKNPLSAPKKAPPAHRSAA